MNIDVHAHIVGPAFYDAIKKIPGVTTVLNHYGMGILKNGETVININEDWYSPKHHVAEMDKRPIDLSLLSLTTPNLYVFSKDVATGVCSKSFDISAERAATVIARGLERDRRAAERL